jgi:hypothetical protein
MKLEPHILLDRLVQRKILGPEQADEALRLSRKCGARVGYTVVRLGYASEEQVQRTLAECHGLAYLQLTSLTIPAAVIELLPECVARECVVMPLAEFHGLFLVAVSDPSDSELLQKLQFILNKDIQPVVALRWQIIDAINRHYGPVDTESVDSMLREFTDTAIDFTECAASESDEETSALDESEFELALNEAVDESGSDSDFCLADLEAEEEPCPAPAKPRRVARQATVRHYHRMNPDKTFPLLVILSDRKILEVVQRGVRQKTSQRFEVQAGSVVEVEPVLPGCTCYPPREQLRIGAGETTAKFWVVPHVLGQVMQARVVVRQDGAVLAEVPLEMRVVKQTLTVLMAALTCLVPLVATVLQHFGIDLRSRLEDGLYSRVAGLLLGSLAPDTLALVLLAATLGLYLWLRPRKRDLFWDVTAVGPVEHAELARRAFAAGDGLQGRQLVREVVTENPEAQASWLLCAERKYAEADYQGALHLYRKALDMGKAPASAYARAALAAGRLGKNAVALAILKEAVDRLPAAQITGAMWYNMGCFAARVGAFGDAVRYLGRAVDAGFANLDKFRTDPDLAPLHRRGDFKVLMACIDS